MKRILAGFAYLFFIICASAQTTEMKKYQSEVFKTVKKDPSDTSAWDWKKGGMVNINIAQGSLSNWAAGGDNFSLSINSYINHYWLYKKKKINWDNNLDFNFGFVQTTSLGSRKNDDRLDFLSKYGYKLDSNRWYLSGLFNFRTQMFDGYTFPKGVQTFSSTFLSPAYVVLSMGFDYKPKPWLSIFMSPVTSRWIIVADEFLSNQGMYGVDSGKHFMNEVGAYATININKGLGKNVTYKGRLDLFSNYKQRPENLDLFMTNIFSFKINKYLSATYNLDIIYDDDVKLFGANKNSPGLQLKSLIGIGFLYQFVPTKKLVITQPKSSARAFIP